MGTKIDGGGKSDGMYGGKPYQNKSWEVENLLLPLSYPQYLALAAQFGQAAEQAFETPCVMNIEAKERGILIHHSLDGPSETVLQAGKQRATVADYRVGFAACSGTSTTSSSTNWDPSHR